MPFGAPFPGNALVVTETDAQNSASGTFSSVNFGAANSGRYLVCALSNSETIGQSGNLNVTIGGVSATNIVTQAQNAISVETVASLWIAFVPTGTSGSVVVGGASGIGNLSLSLYSLVSLSSTTPDATAQQGSGSNNLSQNINVISGGAVIAAAIANTSSGQCVWTGLNVDGNFGPTGSISGSQAHASQLAAQTLTVAPSFSGGVRGFAMAAASFH